MTAVGKSIFVGHYCRVGRGKLNFWSPFMSGRSSSRFAMPVVQKLAFRNNEAEAIKADWRRGPSPMHGQYAADHDDIVASCSDMTINPNGGNFILARHSVTRGTTACS